jgi:hypothetical protein
MIDKARHVLVEHLLPPVLDWLTHALTADAYLVAVAEPRTPMTKHPVGPRACCASLIDTNVKLVCIHTRLTGSRVSG